MNDHLASDINTTKLMGSFRGDGKDGDGNHPQAADQDTPHPFDRISAAVPSRAAHSSHPVFKSGVRVRPRVHSDVDVEALKRSPARPTPASVQLRSNVLHYGKGDVIAERFELLGQIGEGSASLVFSAHDRLEERMVAVKMLRPELVWEDTLQERMRYEAQLTSSLFSPHVVEIIALGQLEDNTSYFAMELLQGETLNDMLVGPLPSYAWIREIGTQIARGLATAHDKGIVHRDLKPSNIFIAREDDNTIAKILDFGVATRPISNTLTKPGTVLGTPHYMAPEQALAFSEVDHRADIYALGTILFELVAGHPPFEADDSMSLVMAHLNERPERLDKLRADVPAKLVDVIERCLEKKPDARFQSAAEVAEALAAICTAAQDETSCHQERSVTLPAVPDVVLPEGGSSRSQLVPASGPTPTLTLPEDGESQARPDAQQLTIWLLLLTLGALIAWQLLTNG